MHRFALFAAIFTVACEGDDTKDTGTAPADPIVVNGIGIACGTDVTLTADISGPAADALVTAADFANNSFLVEENSFPTDADGAIDALTLALGTFPAGAGETAFNCADHYDQASAVMTYVVRAYDSGDVLADCAAGSESGDEQAALDDMFAGAANGGVAAPSEFASCSTDLAISY